MFLCIQKALFFTITFTKSLEKFKNPIFENFGKTVDFRKQFHFLAFYLLQTQFLHHIKSPKF